VRLALVLRWELQVARLLALELIRVISTWARLTGAIMAGEMNMKGVVIAIDSFESPLSE
jgi:hypothetical protein